MAFKTLEGYAWNPMRDWPRNSPCFCGRSAKFKKCCASKMAPVCRAKDAPKLHELIARVKSGERFVVQFKVEPPNPHESFKTQAPIEVPPESAELKEQQPMLGGQNSC